MEKLLQLFLSDTCKGVTTDTRTIYPGCVFFALKGERFNGNNFAIQALHQGALAVVIDEYCDKALENNPAVFKVDNVLSSLQQLALMYRRSWTCPVLAITGSNGKTTTKELIHAVLSKKFRCYATKGNLNNHIGVPLSILSFPADVTFAIIEMGANHQGEISSYCTYSEPDYGLITNTGKAHLEGFGGIEGVIKGKTELFRFIASNGTKVFVPDSGLALLENSSHQPRIVYGKNPASHYVCRPLTSIDGCLHLEIEPEKVCCNLQLAGDYNFDNAAAAVAIGKYFGVNIADIKNALESYTPENNRSQKMQWKSNEVILDAYNANPSSLKVALENFNQIEHPKKIAIIGEMMELGEYSVEEHEKIANQLLSMNLFQRFVVGEGFQFLKNAEGFIYFDDVNQMKQEIEKLNMANSYLLIKGSRKNQLEKLLQ